MAFSQAALTFFRGLAKHNEKPWFEAHREEYERQVRDPMRALIVEMDERFQRFAPEMTGDPKRSMFRINRDIRFSKDKSPYKTHAACWFQHRATAGRPGDNEGGSAGFYFHLAPRSCSIGAGIWMPPRSALGKIRDAIVEDARGFERIVRHRGVVRRFGGLDDQNVLKRMPRGYGEDQPGASWLKYESFTMGRRLKDSQAMGPRLPALLESDFKALLPLVRWLNHAMGLA
ncbi:MAG TPA: DUF2461 domain-containing protein [Gemmatimonadales bacterium]|nr:DUF2461 domain-containing protein [Gemmatimonadales bacterium]